MSGLARMSWVRGTFRGFNYPQYRLLWAGQMTSRFGDLMQQFAVGWLLVELAIEEGTPELAPLYIGLLGLGRGIPALTLGLLAGVVADRMNRRTLLVATRATGAVVALSLAWLVLADLATVANVVALSAISSAVDTIDVPTRHSTVPRLVPPIALVSAQSLLTSTASIATITGPLLAGALIGPIGIGGVMVVKSGFYVAAALTILGLADLPPTAGLVHANVFRSLGQGAMHILTEPVLRWVMALSVVVALFTRPLYLLMPALVKNGFGGGATELSLLLSISGVGAVIGTIIAASLGGVRRRGLVLVWSVLAWGAFVAAFAMQRTVPAAMLLVAFPSIAHFAFASISIVFCQTQSPDSIRARTISIYVMIASAGGSLGALVMGALSTVIGVNEAIALGGVTVVVAAILVLLFAPQIREMRADIEVADGPAVAK
jgi:MFS family permease